jgi:hypothetical protein
MGVSIGDLMIKKLYPLSVNAEWIKPLLPAGCYLHGIESARFPEALATWLRVSYEERLQLPDGPVSPWDIALNTALETGLDSWRFAARIHGQCEIHCFMEGNDKRWIADILENTFISKFAASGSNVGEWQSLVDFLRIPGDFSIVCSYSVCSSFPNFDCLPDGHELKRGIDAADDDDIDARREAFGKLDRDESWDACMRGLRERNWDLKLSQVDWEEFRFGDGTSAQNLRERATKS